MNRSWDKDKGGRDQWIAWLTKIMREAFRVLKPGAHALVWALPRTAGWTSYALEDAGFEIRDSVHHVTGTGFPKSLDVSKAIDASAGAERPIVGQKVDINTGKPMSIKQARRGGEGVTKDWDRPCLVDDESLQRAVSITAPATDAAKEWAGYGTALKPAHEVWWLVRKPLNGTVAANVQEHGTGALNIDGCRVGAAASDDYGRSAARSDGTINPGLDGYGVGHRTGHVQATHELGRWPANFALTHSASCRKVGTTEVKANPTWDTPNRETESTFTGETVSTVRHGDGETETVDVFECDPSCPVRLLDEQSGERKSGERPANNHHGMGYHGGSGWHDQSRVVLDSGGASRFFHCFELTELDDLTPFAYFAKPSRAERDAGLDGFRVLSGGQATGRADGSAALKSPRTGAGRNGGARNVHPTVKSVALMRHLCRLVTPPRGVCLDLFTGSGTTGVACALEGFRFIGAEMNNTDEEPFVDIACARIRHVAGGDYASEPIRATGTHGPRQGSLF